MSRRHLDTGSIASTWLSIWKRSRPMNKRPTFDHFTEAPVDGAWKMLTEMAHTALDAGDMNQAHDLYDRALVEARQRFHADRSPDTLADAPPILVTASANAAECHDRMGDPRHAVLMTSEALHAIRAAMSDTSEHPAFRQACFHHLKLALFEYAERAEIAGVAPTTFKEVALHIREAALCYLTENKTRL